MKTMDFSETIALCDLNFGTEITNRANEGM